MKNIFILGSCVTRDAFELEVAKDYKIVNYLARTSIASSFHPAAVSHLNLSGVASPFQKRMIENDLFKKTKAELLKTEFDWLIIDLIDERFNLYLSEPGELFTLSSELMEQVDLPMRGETIKSGSDDFFKYWCDGWDDFVAFAKENNFAHKILINKVYWTNDLFGGGHVVDDKHKNWIDQNNFWLGRLYEYIVSHGGVQFLEYNQELFLADNKHTWGKQPYHYYEGFYIEFIRKLNFINNIANKTIDLSCAPKTLNFDINKNYSNDNFIAFKGSSESAIHIQIILTLASGKNVEKRELLYSIKYYPDIAEDVFLNMGYALSALSDVGYFKYIPTEPYSVYDRVLDIYIPQGVEIAVISIKEFYPKGKTIILNATASLSLIE